MDKLVQGKVAVVTGGGSGIGQGTAQVFAREGAKVLVADIDPAGGEETVKLIKKAGGEATFIKVNVTKAADIEAMVNQAVKVYGRLDCAYNNAGIVGKDFTIIEDTEENFDSVMSINLKGVWLCLKYEIAYMVKHGGGAIVNTSSVAGLTGFKANIPYNASKAGVIELTKSLAMGYAKSGIRVNAICPGFIRTPMFYRIQKDRNLPTGVEPTSTTPLGRMGTPADIAEAVVWLCSNAASFVTGHAMIVDGGFLAGNYSEGE